MTDQQSTHVTGRRRKEANISGVCSVPGSGEGHVPLISRDPLRSLFLCPDLLIKFSKIGKLLRILAIQNLSPDFKLFFFFHPQAYSIFLSLAGAH
jgi:hypothetical protein